MGIPGQAGLFETLSQKSMWAMGNGVCSFYDASVAINDGMGTEQSET